MQDQQPPPSQKPQLVQIKGGRTIAAAKVQEAFQDEVDGILAEIETLAGFFIVAWDDEGEATSSIFHGKRSPYSSAMLVDVVTQRIVAHSMEPA